MKRIISGLLVVMALAIAMPAQAQIKFGVKGGVNLAKADFDKSDLKTSNFTGFFVGPMVDVTIPIVGLGVDGALLFSQRGIKVNGESEKENGIELPVNLKYSIGLGSLASVYLATGPSYFFSFEGKEVFDNDTYDRKKAQLAWNFGGGVKFLKHFQVGANYNLPISKTAELKGGGEKESYKTKTWQISLGYFF